MGKVPKSTYFIPSVVIFFICQKKVIFPIFWQKTPKMTKLFAKKYEKLLSFLPKILKITKFFAKNTKK